LVVVGGGFCQEGGVGDRDRGDDDDDDVQVCLCGVSLVAGVGDGLVGELGEASVGAAYCYGVQFLEGLGPGEVVGEDGTQMALR